MSDDVENNSHSQDSGDMEAVRAALEAEWARLLADLRARCAASDKALDWQPSKQLPEALNREDVMRHLRTMSQPGELPPALTEAEIRARLRAFLNALMDDAA